MSDTAAGDVPANLQPYLDEISQRLLSGHAAVMVGSGFSRNASPDFPSWDQLGDRLYEILHGKRPDHQTHYLDVPTLAHEVEAALGRPALDRILRDAIPDLASDPSPLHVRLLELPWADVFTTNYDTLLERARSSVSSRRYEIVTKSEDLGDSRKPRIVKLHGSFPSDRPFIVTDEDYRCYPEGFAPFVNTVRQALLENTLCLIGFSGDDPNFMRWIGWIRDKLGRDNAPKMYLVGVLGLSRSQKTLLKRRNIVPLDMSEWPDIDDDHYKALERFFGYLESTRIEDCLGWPIDADTQTPPDRESKPSALAQTWKEQRLLYPGWVIVPEDRRRALWLHTNQLTQDVPAAEDLSDFVDLEFAFELTWRMEKCLCPLFDTQVQFLEPIVDRYLLFAEVDRPLDSQSPSPSSMEARGLTRRDVTSMVHHLLLALMRYYREEGLAGKWRGRHQQLERIKSALSPEHTAHFHYECALFALFVLDLPELKARLSEWPDNPSLSFWSAKKAGLLAEIGQVEEARSLLENALETIRSRLNLAPTTTDYSLVSEESFVMLLLSCAQHPWFSSSGDQESHEKILRKEFSERWHALRQYKCDPWNELEIFERALDRPQPDRSTVTVSPAFDIGHQVKTHRFWNWDNDALTAYNFLRFCEDVGLPFRMPGRIIATKSASGALLRIANYSQAWSITTLLRVNDEKAVDQVFDRSSLAGMDVAQVDNLVALYLNALDLASSDINAGDRFRDFNFGIVLASVVPQILSRLCSKCSESVRERLMRFLMDIYNSNQRGNFRGVRQLLRRLLESFSDTKRTKLIPRLLEFPILSNLNPIEKQEYLNPFVFLDVEPDPAIATATIDDQTWSRFIEHASSSNPNSRKWALSTLQALYKLGLLSAKQKERFADTLWERLDDDGLPSGTDIAHRHEFLTLPHPDSFDPVALFKEHVQRSQFPEQKDATSISIGQPITLCVEICRASKVLEWSDDEACSIVRRLLEWWDVDKWHLKRSDDAGPYGSIADEFKTRFSYLVDTLVSIVKPSLNGPDESAMRQNLSRVIHELSEYGVPALRLEAASLHVFPDRRGRILQSIEDGMVSSSNDLVSDALCAVSVVSMRQETGLQEAGKEDLVRLVQATSQVLRWRSRVGLSLAIRTVAHVIRTHPWILIEDIERPLLLGLECMIADTTYARSKPLPSEEKDELDISTKLIVRRRAAALAFTLHNHYLKQGQAIPDVITQWQAVCESDHEFAEIRNQWSRLSSI